MSLAVNTNHSPFLPLSKTSPPSLPLIQKPLQPQDPLKQTSRTIQRVPRMGKLTPDLTLDHMQAGHTSGSGNPIKSIHLSTAPDSRSTMKGFSRDLDEDSDSDGNSNHTPESDVNNELEGSRSIEGLVKQESLDEDMLAEGDAPTGESPSLCQYMAKCNTGSRDYRKVISHIFGRNKKCTTQIPESCWVIYCRKHYQRTRYRTSKAQAKTYFNIQFDNLVRQLDNMENWGGVRSWTVSLRKKERDILHAEDRQIAQLRKSGANINNNTETQYHKCRERFLLPYCGKEKSFADVRIMVDAIQREVADLNQTELPGFELLPDIDPMEYPPASVRKLMNSTGERSSSASPSIKLLAAHTASALPAPKRPRLYQGTPLKHEDVNSDIEDEEVDGDFDGSDVAESSTSSGGNSKGRPSRTGKKVSHLPLPSATPGRSCCFPSSFIALSTKFMFCQISNSEC